MSTLAAVFVYVGFILALFYLDQRRGLRTSWAIWLPVTYIFLTASRPLSMWLGIDTNGTTEQILDGSPVDRAVYLLFQAASFLILATRWGRVKRALRSHPVLLLFFGYCLISIVWSDFPFTALKRWIKLIAELMLMLVVATEVRPADAMKRLATWPAFVLIPLSVMFIKYFPQLGRTYDPWTGMQQFSGASYNKNMLGVACLMTGLGIVWTILIEFKRRHKDRLFLAALGITLLANLWLLKVSQSTAAQSCFAMGAIVIGLCHLRMIARRQVLLHAAIASMLLSAFFVVFMGRESLQAIGEDATLTGRTELWALLFRMTDNPVLGAGYESFWLGKRLDTLWNIYWWRPNQAHNGYIEIYINLGWVGIAVLSAFLVTTYFRTLDSLKRGDPEASLLLAYVVTAVPFNFTEAAFRIGNLPWILLLVAAVGIPGALASRRSSRWVAVSRSSSRAHENLAENSAAVIEVSTSSNHEFAGFAEMVDGD